MKNKTPLALMEQLVMVLVFALAAALCVSCFVTADRLSQRNALRDEAVLAAQSAAETLKSCSGDYGRTAEVLNGVWNDGIVAVRTNENYSLFIIPEECDDFLLGCARIEVFANRDDRMLFELVAAWQEVGGHG